MNCPHCDYEWSPKKLNPKSCPKCKQRLDTQLAREKATITKGVLKMKNYNEILKDLLTLTNVTVEELDRGDIENAKKFLQHIKEGLELNIV